MSPKPEETMASVENIPPYDMLAPVRNLRVVEKVFELPVASSAYSEIVALAASLTPYVETTITTITPLVEVTLNTIKNNVKENVMPLFPRGTSEAFQSKLNGAVAHLTVGVESLDDLACVGMEKLVDKVPVLKEETPLFLDNSKVKVLLWLCTQLSLILVIQVTASAYLKDTSSFVASFSVAQVYLKIIDASFEAVKSQLDLSTEKNFIASYLLKFHEMANDLRVEGNRRAGTEKARKIEEASVIGAIAEVSGIAYLMEVFGLKHKKAVYEDEHARVEVNTEDELEPVVVDTN